MCMLWSYRWSPLSVAAGVHKSQSLLSKSPKLFRVVAESVREKGGHLCGAGTHQTGAQHCSGQSTQGHPDSTPRGSEETSGLKAQGRSFAAI